MSPHKNMREKKIKNKRKCFKRFEPKTNTNPTNKKMYDNA